jgi:hypothetical protein
VRSDASTAATSDGDGPKSRPNCPGRRKRRKFVELRSDKEAMNEVTADGSGSLRVTSRWRAAVDSTGPSATEWAGSAGLALASSTLSPDGATACALEGEDQTTTDEQAARTAARNATGQRLDMILRFQKGFSPP